jgi:hypothetical protein
VTTFKYEKIVHEDRNTRGEVVDVIIYGRNDLKHKKDCVAKDEFRDGPKHLPLSARKYGPGGELVITA